MPTGMPYGMPPIIAPTSSYEASQRQTPGTRPPLGIREVGAPPPGFGTTAELGQQGTLEELEQWANQLEGGGNAPPFPGGDLPDLNRNPPLEGGFYGDEYEVMNPQTGLPPGTPETPGGGTGEGTAPGGGTGGGGGGYGGGGGETYQQRIARIARGVQGQNPFLGGNNAFPGSQPYTPIPPIFPGAGGIGTPLMPTGGGFPGITTGGQTQGAGLETGGPGQNAEANQEMFGDLVEAWQGAFDQSNEANESRYQDILQGYLAQLGRGKDILSETDEGLGIAGGAQSDRWRRVGGNLEAMEGDLERSREGLTGRMQGEQGRLEDLLGSLGEQGRSDIAEQFGQERGQARQSMINRGLGNTTVQDSMLANVREREGDALGRFYENLVRERVGLGERGLGRELGLGTFGLDQQEAGIGRRYDYGLAGQQFGEQQIERQLGQDRQRLATETGLPREMLQFMERREDTGPEMMDLFQLAMLFGQAGSGDFRARPIGGQYTQLAPQQVG